MQTTSYRRWTVFVLACLLFVLSQFYRASVAVISPELIAELGLSPRGLSLISASFFYAFAAMQIPLGFYLDSIGPRVTMATLSMLAVCGALLFAGGGGLTALVFARGLLGIGMACNLMGTLKLITLWFGPRRFATLSSLVISVGTVGNITAATPLVLMVQAIGWRPTFVVFAGVNFVLVVLFFTVVRDRPGHTAGQRPSAPAVQWGQAASGVRTLLGARDYWVISLGTFCRYGIFAAVQALWAGPYLMKALGVSQVTTGNLLFLMSVGLVIGGPLCGWISDALWRSRKGVIVSGLVGMAAVLAALGRMPAGTAAGILAALFFGFGLFSGAGQIMYAHIKERMPVERAGTAMTGINFFTMSGAAVFLQGLGNLMQAFYPEASLGTAAFRTAFFFCAACLLGTAALYFSTRETLFRGRDGAGE